MASTFSDFKKGLFLHERRYHLFDFILNPFLAWQKLSTWKKLKGFKDSPQSFQLRIQQSNLNIFEFIMIMGSQAHAKEKHSLQWIDEFIQFENLNFTCLNDEEFDLPSLKEYQDRGIVTPYISQIISYANICKEQLPHENNSHYNFSSQNLVDLNLKPFLSGIEYLVRRAVVLEVNVLSIRGELKGSTPNERFQSFVIRNQSRSNRNEFHKKYPVLARLTQTKLKFWAVNTQEMFNRLNINWNLICSTFDIDLKDVLVSLDRSGDTHNNGNTVNILYFKSGKSLVYKPRSISLEEGFQKYINFFNVKSPELNLKTIRTLSCEDYGWVEYVSTAEVATSSELNTFYFKLGALLGIVYSLNGVDVFFENLVASGTNPVIVDLETMFHTSIDITPPINAREKVSLELKESVMSIGILPMPHQGGSENEIFDISVIGAQKNSKAPYKVTGLTNFGRDDISISEIQGWIPEVHSNPTRDQELIGFQREVLHGFDSVMGIVLQNKQEIVKNDGLLDRLFAKATRRLLVRDTKTYGSLQNSETHPDLIKDQLDREWYWDNLWGENVSRNHLSKFIKSELNQLRNGDIPYFSGKVCEKSVCGGDGELIDLNEVIFDSPLEMTKIKNTKLNLDELQRQRWYIASSLSLTEIDGLTQPSLVVSNSELENATVIGDFILSKLTWKSDTAWLETTLNPVPNNSDIDTINIDVGNYSLYDGVSGIALFLSDLSKATSLSRFHDASAGIINNVIQDVKSEFNLELSGYTGKGSLVYTLNRYMDYWGESIETTSAIELLLKDIASKLHKETRLDILSGISGIGLSILPYIKKSNNKEHKKIIEIIYSRLLDASPTLLKAEKTMLGLDYLRGFSHGISGVALALWRMGQFLDRSEFKIIVRKLVLHEANLVNQNEWTDSHTYNDLPLVGWCHGSPGILLALSNMPELLQDPIIKNYQQFALDNTIHNGFYNSKCLCHGSSGNSNILRSYKELYGTNDLLDSFLDASYRDLIKNGFSSFGSAQTMNFGLMTGISGAGDSILNFINSNNKSYLSLD